MQETKFKKEELIGKEAYDFFGSKYVIKNIRKIPYNFGEMILIDLESLDKKWATTLAADVVKLDRTSKTYLSDLIAF